MLKNMEHKSALKIFWEERILFEEIVKEYLYYKIVTIRQGKYYMIV